MASNAKDVAETKNKILHAKMWRPKDLRNRSVARAEISWVFGPS